MDLLLGRWCRAIASNPPPNHPLRERFWCHDHLLICNVGAHPQAPPGCLRPRLQPSVCKGASNESAALDASSQPRRQHVDVSTAFTILHDRPDVRSTDSLWLHRGVTGSRSTTTDFSATRSVCGATSGPGALSSSPNRASNHEIYEPACMLEQTLIPGCGLHKHALLLFCTVINKNQQLTAARHFLCFLIYDLGTEVARAERTADPPSWTDWLDPGRKRWLIGGARSLKNTAPSRTILL